MLNLLLTYDYELFFNDSFASEKEVLIDTTYEIINALNQEEISATFFVDTPSVIAYQKYKQTYYPDMVREQIKVMLDNGFDVQLHIHPIWFKALYDGNRWSFDNDYYSLKSFDDISSIVRESKESLDNLAAKHPAYRCCAFRAGGFCFSPQKELIASLMDEGIVIDSSVCKNVKMDTTVQQFDYTDMPRKYNWFFNEDIAIEMKQNRSLFEIPVGTCGAIPKKYFLTHAYPKLVYPPVKGKPTPVINNRKLTVFGKIRNSLSTPVLFTLDSLHSGALEAFVNYFSKKAIDRDIYVAVIGHPKFSSSSCVENTISFVRKVKNKTGVRFITMRDVAASILDERNQKQ